MADEVTIESLSLKVSSDAATAAKGVKGLATALGEIAKLTAAPQGFKDIVDGIEKIQAALSRGMDTKAINAIGRDKSGIVIPKATP